MVRSVVAVDVVPLSLEFQCSVCEEPGTLTCSRCKSIKYCSKSCQANQWSSHKEYCKEITSMKKETAFYADRLGDVFGLVEEPNKDDDDDEDETFDNDFNDYAIAREDLVNELFGCGIVNNSSLAKELAVEHTLDLLHLSKRAKYTLQKSFVFYNVSMTLSVVIASGRYAKVFEIAETYNGPFNPDLNDAFPLFMYIAEVELLRKYRDSMYTKFWMLMLGTHGRVGEASPVMGIRGCTPVIEMIRFHLLAGPDPERRIVKIKGLEIKAVREKERIEKVDFSDVDPEDWKEKFLQIKALDLENFAKSFKYAKKIGAISS